MVTIWHLFFVWCIFCPLLCGGFVGYPMGLRGVSLGLVVGAVSGGVAFSALRAVFRRYGPSNVSGLSALALVLGSMTAALVLTDFLLHHHLT